jgi:hypothetical protein
MVGDLVAMALKMIDGTNDRVEVSHVLGGLQTLHGILLAESGDCEEAPPYLNQSQWRMRAELRQSFC